MYVYPLELKQCKNIKILLYMVARKLITLKRETWTNKNPKDHRELLSVDPQGHTYIFTALLDQIFFDVETFAELSKQFESPALNLP